MGGMMGGVNPIEWVLPPLALSHLMVDAAARVAAPSKAEDIPSTPDSAADQAKTDQQEQQKQLDAERKAAEDRLALEPRPETPQDVTASRQRAIAASEQLGGARKRRASQTLTDPGRLLGGGSPGSYGP